MPPRVSTGDRDAVLRQIPWCAAVQTLVNCRCQLEENPVGNVEPVQLVTIGRSDHKITLLFVHVKRPKIKLNVSELVYYEKNNKR